MKNVKRLVAILTAAVLCVGMGATSIAGEEDSQYNRSVDTQDRDSALPGGEIESQYSLPENGGVLFLSSGVTEQDIPEGSNTYVSLNNTALVKQSFEDAGYETGDYVLNQIYVKLVTPNSGTVNASFSIGSDHFSTNIYDETKIHPDDPVYALYETGAGTGVWDVLESKMSSDGEVSFSIDHKGGLAIIKATRNGKVVSLSKKSTEATDFIEEAVDTEGNVIEINREDIKAPEVLKVIESPSEISEIIKAKNHQVSAAASIKVLYKKDIEPALDSGPVKMYFTGRPDPTVRYYALHLKEGANPALPDQWEVLECKLDSSKQMYYFVLSSFSPVAIIEVTTPASQNSSGQGTSGFDYSGGTTGSSQKPGTTTTVQPGTTLQPGTTTQPGTTLQPDTTTQTTDLSDKKSPRTGEF